MATHTRRRVALGSCLGVMLAIVAITNVGGAAQAEPMARSAWGVITAMEAGWSQDTMAVHHAGPIVNPGGCKATNAGYATSPADEGHDLFHTVLLSAFLNRKEVSLLVSGCVYDKPHIISVSIR